MVLKSVFKSFSGLRVFEWFLARPTRKIHFKELCRELGLSPLTVKTYCEEFVAREWLLDERQANLRIFSLNDGNYAIKAFKRAFFLDALRECGVEELVNDGVISFALYGSHASGDYDEKSDVDLLVVGRKEQVDYARVKALEKKTGKNIQLIVFSLNDWSEKKVRNPFAQSILRNHVLIKGVAL
ncbi:MAG: nucleotidyltransferase domain-containing protein [Candidatus Micrarchaeota archaeon]